MQGINATSLFFHSQKFTTHSPVMIQLYNSHITTYGEFVELSLKAQKYLQDHKIQRDDSILIFEKPSARMFAFVLAALAQGIQVVFVEPWMPLENINMIISKVKPKLFLAQTIGKIWGLRSRFIRQIPLWHSSKKILQYHVNNNDEIDIIDLPKETIGTLVFTTGTSGTPKGVPRSHDYLLKQIKTLKKTLHYDTYDKVDLAVFPNMVLANMALGKPSILLRSWKQKELRKLHHLPQELLPDTTACGPAFLINLIKFAPIQSIKHIHLGGALSDCWILEKAIHHWPNAEIIHTYGSSEVEPVNTVDAQQSLEKSRKRGFFQALYLGENQNWVEKDFKESGLWVTSDHVCTHYLYNEQENRENKYKDSQGRIWHNMGDRILRDQEGLWYQGRAFQPLEDFLLEQEIYSFLQDSRSFIYRQDENLYLIGEKLQKKQDLLRKEFPQLKDVLTHRIYRDRRHRARIDRKKSMKGLKL